MSIRIILIAMALAFSSAANAQYQHAYIFDTDPRDGFLNAKEIANWLVANKPEFKNLDRDIALARARPEAVALAPNGTRRKFSELDPLYYVPDGDPCYLQTLFVRRNRLDTFQYRGNNDQAVKDFKPVKDALGANVSFIHDSINGQDAVSLNGRVSKLLFQRDAFSKCETLNPHKINPEDTMLPRWLIGAWIDGQGTKASPTLASEQSVVQMGLDFQFAIRTGGLFRTHYLTFSPYALTDFRADASGSGFRFGWEPINADIRLGGTPQTLDTVLYWYWLFRAEVDTRDVDTPGFTRLTAGSYNWVGLYATVKFKLFPNVAPIIYLNPYSDFTDRFYGSVSFQYHNDTARDRNVQKYEAEIGYNLIADGAASISARYTDGNDKDNLNKLRKTVIGLNVKY